jgi:hypothetical protein
LLQECSHSFFVQRKKKENLPTPQKLLRQKLKPEESPQAWSGEEEESPKDLNTTLDLDQSEERKGGRHISLSYCQALNIHNVFVKALCK